MSSATVICMVADKLAKLAKTLYEPTIWVVDIHRDVATLVVSDKFSVVLMKFHDWFLKKKKKKKLYVIK